MKQHGAGLFANDLVIGKNCEIDPFLELGAYEELWLEKGAWFAGIAAKLSGNLPSDLTPISIAKSNRDEVLKMAHNACMKPIHVSLDGMKNHPRELLGAARNSIQFLYYQGRLDLTQSPCVSIVGSRKASESGIRRAKKLVKLLVQDGYTIVSGLAKGIDTAAHTAAIEAGGFTIGVLGTPLSECYPKENAKLQAAIASDHLLISQVPFLRYKNQTPKYNKYFFPERNKTMSALSKATIIVEAGETSGTLVQARSAFQQGRKLLILDSCFEQHSWPLQYEKKGAIRVKDYNQISGHLSCVS